MDSYTTTVVPCRTDASNLNTIFTLPLLFSAVKIVLALIGSPSIKIGSLVFLFIKVPVMVYSLPGSKLE